MSRRVALRLGAVAFACALAMSLSGPMVALAIQPLTSIYGVVTNAATGQPIQGATVSAYSAETGEGATTSTDALGQYELQTVSGTYDVTCYVSNRYEQRTVSGVSADPLSPTLLNFSLAPYARAFYGVVRGSDTGQPIPGAAVTVDSVSGSFSTLVNADGQGWYEVYAPIGTYDLSFLAAGYQQHLVTGRAFEGTAVEVNDTLTPLVAAVYGTVTNATGGAVVPGAVVILRWTVPDPQPDDPDNVQVFELSTRTNAKGEYRFTEAARTYQVRVVSYGFVPSASQDAIFDGSHPVQCDFALVPRVKAVTGKVVEAGTETPLSATVSISGEVAGEPFEDSTATNAQGEYTIYAEPGTYEITVSSSGHLTQVGDVSFDGAVTLNRDFALLPLGADTTDPVTVLTGVPAGWSNTDVTFALAASDLGGSGVAGTYYRIGADGDVTEYVDPVTVSTQGASDLSFWSVDAGGNEELARTAVIRIDKTAPVTTADATAAYTGSASIALTPRDTGGSGVAETKWRLDGATTWTTGTTVSTAAVGAHALEFLSTDNAGNVESVKRVTFAVAGAEPTTLAIRASTTSPTSYGQSIVLYGSLVQASGAGIGGAAVALQTYSASSGTWVTLANTTTASDGTVSWTVRPAVATTYRFDFSGTAVAAPATSTSVLIVPKASVSKVAASRYASRAYRFSGTLKPRHKVGTYPVRVYRWKKVGRKWVSKGYTRAKVADYQGHSRYSAKYTFPSKGSWRLQAVAPGDGSHRVSKSSYTYLTVR